MESGSYYGRIWSGSERDNFSAYILYMLLNLAAPPIISATVYISLARVIRALEGRDNALMGPRKVAWLFICGDIIAWLSQIAGAGMQATTSNEIRGYGQTVVIVGLVFQLVLLGVFILNIYIFHRRNRNTPTPLSVDNRIPPWQRRMCVLYFSGGAIFIRNLFRIIEYAGGPDGEANKHEALIYVFDAFLMLAVMVALVFIHPGRLVKKASRLGKTNPGEVEMLVGDAYGGKERPLSS